MRDNTLKWWVLAAAAMLLLPASAYPAGLGRLTVLSTLGHTLEAEVELLSVQKNETITGRLASPEIYSQANAQYNNALVGTRVTLERRSNGQPYLKVTTLRAVTEPFIELLIEINSENGRVMRQYTALLDPPGYGRAAGEIPPPAVASAPQTRAAPPAEPIAAAPAAPAQEFAPPAAAPAAARPAAAPRPAPAPAPRPAPAASAGGKQYGPIKSGETLSRIARSVKPEGVSLEQTLVGLYRQNPDAFIKKNMNLVRAGRILKVPEAEEFASVAPRAAAQEVRLHVADFNAYRNYVADRAVGAPEEGSVASGRIGSRVAGPAAGEGSRDTVRLSRGEGGKGSSKGGAADRVRALEEQAVAREKALAEANARIAKLEQIIKDSQRAVDLKSGSAAAPTQKGADKAAPAASPSTVAVAPPSASGAKGAQAPAGGPSDAAKGAPADAAKGAPASGPGPAKAVDGPADAKPTAEPPPVAKAKKPAAPPPAPEPGLLESIAEEPLYLAVGGTVILLGGLGFMMARRRRTADAKSGLNEGLVKIAPSLAGGPGGKSAPSAGASARTTAPPAPPAAPSPAAAAAPAATRAPSPAAAPQGSPATAGATPPATAPATAPATPPKPRSADDNDLDFNVATGRSASAAGARRPPAPELKPAPQRAPEPAPVPPPSAVEPAPRTSEPPQAAPPPVVEPPPQAPQAKPAQPPMPDFALDTSALTPSSPKAEPKAPAADPHVMDFNLDPLPPVGSPLDLDKVSSEPPAAVDFKLDLKDLDVNTPPQRTGGAAGRDDHWYDVQQKFDLAKAYEEMGDKDGARDILQEVVREGDAEQQAQAKKQLGSLG